ncbi:hypothetical protein GUJ93_ZPchr0009g363 [Zizania palustris]|uniref:Uncharacterized protein n=1 Tax=Zizania palustris TaxID=103762 RepID=A0A8J5UYY8_ZIZPA|nr:hypothetical protein GUJ93_ZPchr0009g363 [Zizania palustris]
MSHRIAWRSIAQAHIARRRTVPPFPVRRGLNPHVPVLLAAMGSWWYRGKSCNVGPANEHGLANSCWFQVNRGASK